LKKILAGQIGRKAASSARDWHLHLAKRLQSLTSINSRKHGIARSIPQPIQDIRCLNRFARIRLGLLPTQNPIHVAASRSTYDFFRSFRSPRVRIPAPLFQQAFSTVFPMP